MNLETDVDQNLLSQYRKQKSNCPKMYIDNFWTVLIWQEKKQKRLVFYNLIIP